jgi:UDP-N-acetylmuramoyl-L-alanyl-D-glutamate--2,6-diaminopimelate ligase
MKLSVLLNGITYDIVRGNTDMEISDICWDSRRTSPGSIFICVRNKNADRHDFAAEAVKNVAAALIVAHDILELPKEITVVRVENSKHAMAEIASRFYGRPSEKFYLIGITGTNGKTSTAYFIEKILEYAGRRVGILSTVENRIDGKKLKIEKLNPTTPDAIELQSSFYEMVRNGVDDVVMEVTSAALDRERVYGCDFNTGIFTNLTQDHLDDHGTMENYKNAKIKLFNMCKNGVINVDDPVCSEITGNSSCKIITYGIDNKADIKAQNIKYFPNGTSFDIDLCGIVKEVFIKVPGRFNVYNVLAACGACILSGMTFEEIISGTGTLQGVRGRFELVPNNKGIFVIIDYAHTPDSLEKILTAVRGISEGRVITVFGCGGDRDKTKRPVMGEIAGRLSDLCILTSDNPRSEEPAKIIMDTESGILKTACSYEKIENRREGIKRAIYSAEENDIIIIAGKGHETYQILKDKTIHFDDRETANEILKDLKGEQKWES